MIILSKFCFGEGNGQKLCWIGCSSGRLSWLVIVLPCRWCARGTSFFDVSLWWNTVYLFQTLLSGAFLIGVFTIQSCSGKLEQGNCIANLEHVLNANKRRLFFHLVDPLQHHSVNSKDLLVEWILSTPLWAIWSRFLVEMHCFFPVKSPTEILKIKLQRQHAFELLDFFAGFATFLESSVLHSFNST